MNLKSVLTTATFFLLLNAAAQQNNIAEALSITAGGTFGKSKIAPKLTKLGIAQVTVDFKQMSTKAISKTEKKQGLFGKTAGKSATASVTAYLETTDGELENSDYVEITNHFYYYLQRKLKESGIDTVAWSAVAATDFFTDNAKEKNDDNEEEKKKGNSWISYNAFNGSTMFNGNGGMAFLKMKKNSKMCDAIDAPTIFVYATVEFADIDVNVDVKTGGYKSTWTPGASSQTTTMSSKTSVGAVMKVAAMNGMQSCYLSNHKEQAENINVVADIPAEMDYATSLTEDPARAEKRSKIFHIGLSKKMESDPVVITTTKDKYKAAAKKALEKYADAMVAKFMAMKKD